MTAKFTRSSIPLTWTERVDAVEITGFRVQLGSPGPVVTLELVAEGVEADGKTPTRVALTRTYEGEVLGPLFAAATIGTIEAKDIYAGIKGALYAQLKADGAIPADAEVS